MKRFAKGIVILKCTVIGKNVKALAPPAKTRHAEASAGNDAAVSSPAYFRFRRSNVRSAIFIAHSVSQ